MNASTEAPDLIRIGEAAKLLGVSVETVRRWEDLGYLTAVRTPGRQRRFNREAVKALTVGRKESRKEVAGQ